MPKPKDKIPPVLPQRDSDINDPSEPYDDYLKFNIENDNLFAVEIKDFEIFLFGNDKRFSVTRENIGYNVYHPHIVDVEGQNPSNMRKCHDYSVLVQSKRGEDWLNSFIQSGQTAKYKLKIH